MKTMKINHSDIPQEVQSIARVLTEAGFLAYLVGGCVRDLLLDIEPKDWDVATNALPEQIQKLFPNSVYENDFGTVGVKIETENPRLKIIEVTTFRVEGEYRDARHPGSVTFVSTIEEDLSRRDFTVNALAIELTNDQQLTTNDSPSKSSRVARSRSSVDCRLIDPFEGQNDLKKKIIRAVGKPEERFEEDALRLLRAVRFSCQLDFEIAEETKSAIRGKAPLLGHISKERIRDEFEKIIMTPRAWRGMELLRELNLLEVFAPELVAMVGVEQNLHHIYTVWEHCVRALDYAAKKKYPLRVRLAALLHDVGKPATKRGTGKYATFHGHEVIGARMVKTFLTRLHFSKQIIDDVTHLVRQHQFYYNVGEISEAGVRRFIKRVGIDYLDDLMRVRESDRIGSGVPKATPYKNRHLLFMIDKVRRDPISPKMLAVDGQDVMRVADLEPSPKVGMILNALLEEVLDDPSRNTPEYLEGRIHTLNELSEKELVNLAQESKKKQEVLEGQEEEEMKKKHWV